MSHRNLMRDPRYSGILYAIESKLHDADRLAATRGVSLTDSNIRSALVRAVNEAKGKPPKPPEGAASDKDRFLYEVSRELAAVRATIAVETTRSSGSVERSPLPAADWILALEAIKDSCETRTTDQPGSRDYLEFLRGFIKKTANTP